MNRTWTLAGSVALGAGLMYVFDPGQGHRRRARLGDQGASLGRRFSRGVSLGARDARLRASGLIHEANARRRPETVSDHVLAERVRARLGHLVEHPHAVRIEALNGRVIVSGPILAHERERCLAGVGRVRGVAMVEDRLDAHEDTGNVPARQRAGRRPGLGRLGIGLPSGVETWPPRWRLGLGLAGAVLVALGSARSHGARGLAASLGGALLLTRGFTNTPLSRLTGVGAGRRAVDIEKIVNIHAPMDRVFAYWSEFTNFPRFMAHVRAIHDRGDGRYHWVVDGPAGLGVGWDAVVTKLVPGELLAWKSEPGAIIESAGVVTFRPNDDGGTRVQVRMSYNPVAGLIGHGVARFFRVDPKRQMDDDLARMKSYLETGVTPHDAADQPVKSQFYH